MFEPVFIGLGSNLGDSESAIQNAVNTLATQDEIHLVSMSSLYKSAPMGPENQPDYLNAVCQIKTTLSPEALLDTTQRIENENGRKRVGERWGARTLDLDILLYAGQSVKTERLTIPHAGMPQREFVLVPLFEIAPTLIMPDGYPISKWVAACTLDGLARLR